MMPCCVGYVLATHNENLLIVLQVIADNVGNVFDSQCMKRTEWNVRLCTWLFPGKAKAQDRWGWNTRNSAIADKPRDAFRSVKVTKHVTIPYDRYGFILVSYSNFVRKTHRFEIFDFKYAMPWPWKPG